MLRKKHTEGHFVSRIGWLRAAVLGANDGIISTAGLLIGVASANGAYSELMVAGVAGLIAGAVSMAAGEYISVSSQSDTEKSALQREKTELETNQAGELEELTAIYIERGVDKELAREVAQQLMAKDALGAHARDELGIVAHMTARPLQAAIFSACSFTIGSLPLLAILTLFSHDYTIPAIVVSALIFLAILGALAAKLSGSNMIVGAIRVLFWGSFAMLLTAAIGSLLGVTI